MVGQYLQEINPDEVKHKRGESENCECIVEKKGSHSYGSM